MAEEKTLKTDDAIALWLKGKDMWNEWAENHEGWTVDFTDHLPKQRKHSKDEILNFGGFIFPGRTLFIMAIFPSGTYFSAARFLGVADFCAAKFLNTVIFTGVLFEKNAVFINCLFKGLSSFSHATFEENATFIESNFTLSVGFIETRFLKSCKLIQACFLDSVDFSGATFTGSTNFSDAKFSGESNFSGIDFLEITNFSKVTFINSATFVSVTFLKTVYMYSLVSKSTLNLSDSKFFDKAYFTEGSFEKAVILSGVKFKNSIPDFTMTKFSHHISVSDIELPDIEKIKSADIDAGKKLRRMRELANISKDHKMELEFFASEQKARRYDGTSISTLIPNYLYGFFSGFGQSLFRPFLGLLGFWYLFAWVYYALSGIEFEHFADSLIFSASQMLPFSPMSKTIKEQSLNMLFDNPQELGLVYLVSTLESVVSLILIGLIGLALRNRFKMK